MQPSCGTKWLLALMMVSSLQPTSAWFLQARTSPTTLPHSRGFGTRMAATPSPGHDDNVSASLTRGEWLRVGASLAAIAPVLALGKDDEALAAVASSGRFGNEPGTGSRCPESFLALESQCIQ